MAKHRGAPSRADVLKGKVKPGVHALVGLIAEVNPTDRGLSPAEAARRYAEKSALQGLLLRWYGEAFVAERTDDEDIVLLRHRPSGASASHARLSSLDDEARAWVRASFDGGAAGHDEQGSGAREVVSPRGPLRGHPPSDTGRARPEEVLAGPPSAESEAELLSRADEALAAYDYELAERHLVAAFEASAGETLAPARALLALTVDVLGQAAQALELAERMSAEVRAAPDVLVLLGLAAAQTGDVPRALSIARGLEHPRAGEIWNEAGLSVLRSGDLTEARRCASRARSLGAAASCAALEAAIERALRVRAVEADARLEALLAGGDEAAAEALAREILAGGVPSASAQRLLKEAADARAIALSEQARAALAAGDLAAARAAQAELARLGRADRALEARIVEAERAASTNREAEAVGAALEALAGVPVDAGIARYLELSPQRRARVRAAGPAALAALAALADAVAEALGPRRIVEVPAAVARVSEVERLVEAGEVDAALAAVEALPRELDAAPCVRRLSARAQRVRDERLLVAARGRLATARRCYHAGDFEAAAREARAITPAHLRKPADELALAELIVIAEFAVGLAQSARRARLDGADLAALQEGRRAAGDLAKLTLGIARDRASELDALGDESASRLVDKVGDECVAEAEERARAWAEEQEKLGRALTAALRFEAFEVPEGTVVALEDEQELGRRAPDARIAADRKVWFIASPEERCYLTEATLPDLVVTRRFAFSAGALRRGQNVLPVGDTLWIPLSEGGMIVLDRTTPSSVLDVWWGRKTGNKVDDTWSVPAPDGGAVVFSEESKGSKDDRDPRLRLVPSGLTRRLRHAASVAFFGKPGRLRLLVTGDRSGPWTVLAVDGTSLGGPERFTGAFAGLVPIAAVEDRSEGAPEGGGYVFLAVDTAVPAADDDDPPSHGALYLVRVTADLRPVARSLVTEKCDELSAWLYATRKNFLVVRNEGMWPKFDVFTGATLEREASLLGIRGLTVPIQDAWGRRLRLLERTNRHFRVVDAPTSIEQQLAGSGGFPSELLSSRALCAQVPDLWARSLYSGQLDGKIMWAAAARGDRARRLLMAESSRTLRAFPERVLERMTASTVLLLLYAAPQAKGVHGFFLGAEHAVGLCPSDPELVARLEAALELFEEQWAKGHALHLLGLAHLAAGRREEAVAAWRRGASFHGNACPFHILIAATGGLSGEARAAYMAELGQKDLFAGQAAAYEEGVAAMKRLDAALEAGRGEEAWAEAGRVRDATGPSAQLSARVAELHLRHPAPSADPWRRQLDLAWMASEAWLRPTLVHMVFAGCHWHHERFSDIAKRAGAALDAMGVGPAERQVYEEGVAAAEPAPDGQEPAPER